MIFADRLDAARRLAARLGHLKGSKPLVLAIPRGGVPLGRVIADALGGELDVVLVRKLGAPFNREFAIGAVDESGRVQVSEEAGLIGVNPTYVEQEKNAQLAQIRERRSRWGGAVADPSDRVVIVVDDGLATGLTMASALLFLRARNALRLVCAVPVASRRGVAAVAPFADEVVALAVPEEFRAVSLFYGEFPQVEDDEVVHLLAP